MSNFHSSANLPDFNTHYFDSKREQIFSFTVKLEKAITSNLPLSSLTLIVEEMISSSNVLLHSLQLTQQSFNSHLEAEDSPIKLAKESANDAASNFIGLLFGVLEDNLALQNWSQIYNEDGDDDKPRFGFINSVTHEIDENLPKLKQLDEDCTLPWVWNLISKIPMLFTPGKINNKTVWAAHVLYYDPVSFTAVIDLIESNDENEYVTTRQLHSDTWRGPNSELCIWEQDLSLKPGTKLETWQDVTASAIAFINSATPLISSSSTTSKALVIGGSLNLPNFLANSSPSFLIHTFESNALYDAINTAFFQVQEQESSTQGVDKSSSNKNRKRRGGGFHNKTNDSIIKSVNSDEQNIVKLDHMPDLTQYSTVIIAEGCVIDITITSKIILQLNNSDSQAQTRPSAVIQTRYHDICRILRLFNDAGLSPDFEIRQYSELVLHGSDTDAAGIGSEGLICSGASTEDGDDDESRSEAVLLHVCSIDLPRLSEDVWQKTMLVGMGINTSPVALDEAQRSQAITVPSLLTPQEITELKSWGDSEFELVSNSSSKLGIDTRSASPSKAWQVAFLQTNNEFESRFPEIIERVKSAVLELAKKEWKGVNGLNIEDGEELNVRCAEYHKQVAPGPGLGDPKHYDMDSAVTVDIVLSDPQIDFTGGSVKTLESEGQLKTHKFKEKGDAVVFVSHKFHCVEPVFEGVRNVLVIELWRGPTRTCGHRCECLNFVCPLEKNVVKSKNTSTTGEADSTKPMMPWLPFRLGASVNSGEVMRLLWQSNEANKVVVTVLPTADEKLAVDDEVWDMFGGGGDSDNDSD